MAPTVIKALVCCVVLGIVVRTVKSSDASQLPNDLKMMDLKMKGAHPVKNDEYFCTSYSVPPNEDSYIVKFEAKADASTAHHILVFGCMVPHSTDNYWKCGSTCGTREQQIIFAWAKNAPPLELPKGVGRHIGARALIRHIVVQIHYAHALDAPDFTSGVQIYTTEQRQKFVAGIYLLMSSEYVIPANTSKVHADISCVFDWKGSVIYPFAFRTHAHVLSTVISGYRLRGDEYTLIGKGNPQWPQAFYPVGKEIYVQEGDILGARCTYNSTGRYRATRMGATANDEMCNFYMMYYVDAAMEYNRGNENCQDLQAPFTFPAGSDVPLPPNPALDEVAHHHHHHVMTGGSGDEPAPTNEENIGGPIQNVKANLLVDEAKGEDAAVIGNHFKSQGYKHSTSTNRNADNVRKSSSNYNSLWQRPNPYLLEYDDYPDYYDIMRQRNRVKKPYYDLYDTRTNGFGDFTDKIYDVDSRHLSKSRNRNKIFQNINKQHNDYYNVDDDDDKNVKSSSKGDSQHSHGSNSPKGGHSNLSKGSNSNISSHTGKKGGHMEHAEAVQTKPEDSVLSANFGMTFISEVSDRTTFGQIGGLATNNEGDLYVFHRGSRIWNSISFNADNVYLPTELPVTTDAIVILNHDGKVIRQFGKNSYYLPHGLSLDSNENIWLTDVALHQVFRIPRGEEKPDLTLGERWIPGDDSEHFCKPTDVAVLSTGEFFVSDGYCNSRIMKFDKNGNFIKQWGTGTSEDPPSPGTFILPHSLALAEDKGLLCVADRENGRIQCFDFDGNFVRQMKPSEFGSKLYAVEYCELHGGILFAVNGPGYSASGETVQGFTLDVDTGKLLAKWNIPKRVTVDGLSHPHDVTVDSKRHAVYVGELNPAKVWKFQMTKSLEMNAHRERIFMPPLPKVTDGTSDSSDSYATSLVVGVLLIVPVVLVVIITILVRLYHQGRLGGWRSRGKAKMFNLGNLLNSHKGFDRLSTEDDDHDLENAMDDSDNEEFNITKNMKA